jgi:hypothetical protein
MSLAKYKAGQVVEFSPGRAMIPVTSREYTILRLLPLEGTEHKYRIKTLAEQFERIAKESELALPDAA